MVAPTAFNIIDGMETILAAIYIQNTTRNMYIKYQSYS